MNEQLTTKQKKTIEALLLTNTIDRAAKRANVSEASIYRWMKQESFQTALRAARRDILAHTTTRLRKVGKVGTGDDFPGRRSFEGVALSGLFSWNASIS